MEICIHVLPFVQNLQAVIYFTSKLTGPIIQTKTKLGMVKNRDCLKTFSLLFAVETFLYRAYTKRRKTGRRSFAMSKRRLNNRVAQ